MTTRPPKAYSYLRFSTPDQALGDSKRRQVEAARAWAVERGLTLDEELADEGVSGFRGANTRDDTQLGSFLRAVQAGDVPVGSVLILESLDRLSRDRILAAQNVLTSLLLAGITVVTLGDRREYSEESVNANPIDMIASLLVLMRANEESETKAKRLRAVWENKRAKATSTGVRMTSTCPAWLAPGPDGRGFVLRENRAAIVRRIFLETAAGRGQHRIAADLTFDGVPNWGRGRGWHRTYIRKIIDSPAVVGDLVPHVTERLSGGGRTRKPIGHVVRGYYPAVVDEELWHQARAAVGTRAEGVLAPRGKHADKPVRHLLAGLARCGACGGTMTRVSKGPKGGGATLVCATAKRGAGCSYRSVRVAEVEVAIYGSTVDLLEDHPSTNAQEAEARAALDIANRHADAVRDQLQDLRETREARKLLPVERAREAELFKELQAIEDEQKELVRRLNALGSRLVAARVSRLWDALAPPDDIGVETPVAAAEGPEDKTLANAAMRECFVQVVIEQDPKGLVFHWRHGGVSRLAFGNPFSDER